MQTITQVHGIDYDRDLRTLLDYFNVSTYAICLLFIVTTFGQSTILHRHYLPVTT